MRGFWMVLALLLAGCGSHVVRDPVVYKAEIRQWDNWAVKQAGLLKSFMAIACACDAKGVFTTDACVMAADYVLTVEARHEWHQQMALHLGGLVKERPSKVPPAIPESKTLCPVKEGEQ